MDKQSIQHTRWNCTYHIVFIPKYRRKIMYGANRMDIQLLELIGRHEIAMAVDPNRVAEGFDVFEGQPAGMCVIPDSEAAQPVSLYERVEGFDTGIVVRVYLVAVAGLELLRCCPAGLGNILAATVRVQNQGLVGIAMGFRLIYGFDDAGAPHVVRKSPGGDLGGTGVLFGLVADLPYILLYGILALLDGRRLMLCKCTYPERETPKYFGIPEMVI